MNETPEREFQRLEGSTAKARAWGTIVHLPNGKVVLDPIPWPESRNSEP
jgi:hypothetical protein